MSYMKKIINSIFLMAALLLLLQSFEFDSGSKRRRDGTAPGYTGSPGDSFKNCTACHGGFTENVDNWIVSNIPSTGWVPGQRYTITATNTKMGATRFGFEVSPQAYDGRLLGEMIITDTGATQLVGDRKYVTYKAAGVDGVDSRSWSFDWIAPDSTISEVGFYGAFNSNPGHKDNDRTYLSVLKVYREGHKSDISQNSFSPKFNIFPNPVSDFLNVSFNVTNAEYTEIAILDLNGRKMQELLPKSLLESGFFSQKYDVKNLPVAWYILSIKGESFQVNQSVFIAP